MRAIILVTCQLLVITLARPDVSHLLPQTNYGYPFVNDPAIHTRYFSPPSGASLFKPFSSQSQYSSPFNTYLPPSNKPQYDTVQATHVYLPPSIKPQRDPVPVKNVYLPPTSKPQREPVHFENVYLPPTTKPQREPVHFENVYLPPTKKHQHDEVHSSSNVYLPPVKSDIPFVSHQFHQQPHFQYDVVSSHNQQHLNFDYNTENSYQKRYQQFGSGNQVYHEIAPSYSIADDTINNGYPYHNNVYYDDANIVQQEPEITKNFYYFSAPQDEYVNLGTRYVQIGKPQKNYKVIFIKTPAFHVKQDIVPILPKHDDKTLIYVLNKKPEIQTTINVQEPEPQEPSKPSVIFLKYNTAKEADEAQKRIQTFYETNKGSNADSVEFENIEGNPQADDTKVQTVNKTH